MRITRLLAVGVLTTGLGIGLLPTDGVAQIREQQPAEFPPASFKGKQYVDSTGCVFIRAGIDGNVTWVPRVSRDRKVICGFRPSLSEQVAEAPAEVPAASKSAAAPEVIAPKSPPAAVAAKPAAAAPMKAAAAKPRKAAKPRVVRQTAPKRPAKPKVVAAAPAPKVVVAGGEASACVGASAISAEYLRGRGVRCGPQAHRITPSQGVTAAPAGQLATVGAAKPGKAAEAEPRWAQDLTTETRIVPRHVAQNRVNTRNVAVPKGYRPVWTDDRLNPYRAEQNLQGRSDMLLVWTQTVPRRLIDSRSGRDVTAKVPLIYPYTSVAQQRAEMGEVTLVRRDGKLMKKIVRKPGARKAKPVYSTRSAPKKVASKAAPVKSATGARYVQVGTYRVEANARRAAQTIARMGMRARIGKSGSGLMSVQAGPFAGQDVQVAIRRLRGAGYADAFAR